MLQVIKENSPSSKWVDSPLKSYRLPGNTNRGDVGEIFVERLLISLGMDVRRVTSRIKEWDLIIKGKKFEVKSASEGKDRTFEFNHVRLDRKYDFLIYLGVCPYELRYDFWSKGEIAEGKGGLLVRMAEGRSITFKITRNTAQLTPIDKLFQNLEERLK